MMILTMMLVTTDSFDGVGGCGGKNNKDDDRCNIELLSNEHQR